MTGLKNYMRKAKTSDNKSREYNPMHIGRSAGSKAANIAIFTFLGLLAAITIFPFYNMLVMSFSSYEAVARSAIYLYPKVIDLSNYRIIFSEPTLKNSFAVTIFITAAGVLFSMIVTTFGGYALSRKDLPGRNAIFVFIIIPMYFTAGLIPWYLVVNELGFTNSIWSMIIPPGLNIFNLILMKNFFNTIPDALEESAHIDGANDLVILFRIIIPVSAPIIATISLFYAVERWNEWWFAMIFIRDVNKIPLQLLLRKVVIESTMDLGTDMANSMRNSNKVVNSLSIQMATVAVATAPILFVYPFVQRHFTKGIMLGAIKS